MKRRINNIEFRWSDMNQSYELVEWFKYKEKESCIVVAFFKANREGYDMETVGTRYLDSCDRFSRETMALTRYAFAFLEAEFLLEQEIEEISLTQNPI